MAPDARRRMLGTGTHCTFSPPCVALTTDGAGTLPQRPSDLPHLSLTSALVRHSLPSTQPGIGHCLAGSHRRGRARVAAPASVAGLKRTGSWGGCRITSAEPDCYSRLQGLPTLGKAFLVCREQQRLCQCNTPLPPPPPHTQQEAKLRAEGTREPQDTLATALS